MSDLIVIKNVRGRMNASGYAELNLEDVARGLGFTRTAASGNEVVRWERVRGYLIGFGIAVPTCGHEKKPLTGNEGLPEMIPENIFYKLCFKAENKTAIAFQDIVTDEILPAIRKHGGYLTPEKIKEALADPDMIIQLATSLKEEQSKRKELEAQLDYSKEWLSIKRVAAMNGVAWKTFDWRRLKKESIRAGLGVKKIFDANYGEVNTYHQTIWERTYPQYEV